MDGFTLWLVCSLSMWSLGEGINCSYPMHDGEYENTGIVCQWEHEDFFYDEKEREWILLPEDSNDNWFEDKVRKKYWEKRN